MKKLCACRCGERPSPGRDFAPGHNQYHFFIERPKPVRGKLLTLEEIQELLGPAEPRVLTEAQKRQRAKKRQRDDEKRRLKFANKSATAV
jgi:hypothetical protein